MSSISEYFQYLIYLTDEKGQLIINESKSCINTHSPVDLDIYENP